MVTSSQPTQSGQASSVSPIRAADPLSLSSCHLSRFAQGPHALREGEPNTLRARSFTAAELLDLCAQRYVSFIMPAKLSKGSSLDSPPFCIE